LPAAASTVASSVTFPPGRAAKRIPKRTTTTLPVTFQATLFAAAPPSTMRSE
jgi:hypothetical protein